MDAWTWRAMCGNGPVPSTSPIPTGPAIAAKTPRSTASAYCVVPHGTTVSLRADFVPPVAGVCCPRQVWPRPASAALFRRCLYHPDVPPTQRMPTAKRSCARPSRTRTRSGWPGACSAQTPTAWRSSPGRSRRDPGSGLPAPAGRRHGHRRPRERAVSASPQRPLTDSPS